MTSVKNHSTSLSKLIEDVVEAHDEADLGAAQENLRKAVNDIPDDERTPAVKKAAGENWERLTARFAF